MPSPPPIKSQTTIPLNPSIVETVIGYPLFQIQISYYHWNCFSEVWVIIDQEDQRCAEGEQNSILYEQTLL